MQKAGRRAALRGKRLGLIEWFYGRCRHVGAKATKKISFRIIFRIFVGKIMINKVPTI